MHLLSRKILQVVRTTSTTTTIKPLIDSFSELKYSNNTASNATGIILLESEENEGGLTEIQAVALACMATLIPLCIILILAFCVRSVWRKFRKTEDNSSPGGSTTGVLKRDESSDPTANKSVAASTGQLLPDDIKTSESALSVTPIDETKLEPPSQLPLSSTSTGVVTSSGPPKNHQSICSSKSANGSIITLTMQNNHLIVETESVEEELKKNDIISADSLEVNEEEAEVHEPPRRSPSPPCYTGLSQSLSSITSPSYCYGSQVGYPYSKLGYELNLGYLIHSPVKTATKTKKHNNNSKKHQVYKKLLMQLSLQNDNFEPIHHRSSSLPMNKLLRTQTIATSTYNPDNTIKPVIKEIPESNKSNTSSDSSRHRASLPIINPVINKLNSEAKSHTVIKE